VSGETVGALDIGGTHVTAGRVDVAAGSVDPRSLVWLRFSPSATREDLVAAISRAAASLAAPGVGRLGVAVPGPFDYAAGRSQITHKLQGLYGVDLRGELERAVGLDGPQSVRFVNDAEAFLLGEWRAGAARGHARAVGVTLGTGLGSAFLDDGRVLHGGAGVPEGGALYELPFRGAPVEETISSRGLLARHEGASDVAEVARRAAAGEAPAVGAFRGLGEALGEFLAPWLSAFRPGCFVVGGSIARSFGLLEPGLRRGLERGDWAGAVSVAAQLDEAPLIGAAWHARGEPA
jgi:predicted NBD/HSP70 family sugar kinase